MAMVFKKKPTVIEQEHKLQTVTGTKAGRIKHLS